MMDQETANLALQFMNRVQLQGNEVPAWLTVVQALKREAGQQVNGAQVDESATVESEGQPDNAKRSVAGGSAS